MKPSGAPLELPLNLSRFPTQLSTKYYSIALGPLASATDTREKFV